MPTVKVEDIRAQLAIRFPLFMKFLVDTPFIEDPMVNTLETDGKEVRFNPEFVGKRKPNDQFFMFAHELAHVFCGHPLRLRPDWDYEMQQVASDIAVNSILLHSGLDLPSDACYEFKWRDWGFEDIYRALEKEKQEQPQSVPQKHKHNENKHGQVDESPDLKGEPEETEDQLQGSQKREQAQAQLIEEHNQKMEEAIQMGRMAGNIPEALEIILKKLLPHEINWKDAFAEFMVRCTDREDYTFTRPNRKSEDAGVILPGMYSERGQVVAFAGDTSGSMSLKMIEEMSSEVLGLVEDVSPEELYLIWCSSRVAGTQHFEEGEDVKPEPKGRGGTDYRPVFEWLEQQDVEPDVLVYMTDGECSYFPTEHPTYPVLWMLWQDINFQPPFGDVIVFKHKK